MRKILKLAMFGALVYAAKSAYEKWTQSSSGSSSGSSSVPTEPQPFGRDTATGTDPDAKWSEPGYQDKSLGQAVNQDEQLVDRLMDETGGDVAEAEARFRTQSAGAPALARQEQRDPSS
jgi:hypothetical protein